MKKKLVIGLSSFLIIVLVTFIFLGVGFVNSYKFINYKQLQALKNKDSSIVMQYYDVEKIIDNSLSKSLTELNNDPFASLGFAIASNMRPTLIQTATNELEKSFTNGDPKLDKLSPLQLIYHSMFSKPISPDGFMITKKINADKYAIISGRFQENFAFKTTYQRINKKWRIVNIEQDSLKNLDK